ncbi:hypothetical protein PQX77_005758 [Marasmius sp. AFHP31]|nr:hypothetical protein PQX77_005758 [Marasmius sp. AFHP31]
MPSGCQRHPKPHVLLNDHFAIPFPHQFSGCGVTLRLDRFARDVFATLPEIEYYMKCWPTGFNPNADVFKIPRVGLPDRYKDNVDPYTIQSFFDYTSNFSIINNALHHTDSALPVCMTDSFITYRHHARKIVPTFNASGAKTSQRFNMLVHETAGMHFVDGLVYARFWVKEIPLPPIAELGLLGDLTMDQALRLPRTTHAGVSSSYPSA